VLSHPRELEIVGARSTDATNTIGKFSKSERKGRGVNIRKAAGDSTTFFSQCGRKQFG